MKIALAIQARLGSTRLPEKALKPLHGLTLVDQLVKQVRAARSVNEVLLTTSDREQDKRLMQHFKAQGMRAFGAPVDDIVGRLYGTLTLAQADVLVRVWGDCPFVCPDIIDQMLAKFQKERLDFLANGDITSRTFPPGLDVEIYSKKLLVEMNKTVTDVKLREFPIEFVRTQREKFAVSLFQDSENRSHFHLTVDYPEDLAAAGEILAVLAPQNQSFTYPELTALISARPELFARFSKQPRNVEYKNFVAAKPKDSK